jgi:hypothetical protein
LAEQAFVLRDGQITQNAALTRQAQTGVGLMGR